MPQIELSTQVHRESRGLPWLDGLARDVRYALRTLRRSPGFTLTAIGTLAIGIGVNAAVFTVTNATLFKGFPLVERNDRILYVTTGRGCCVSYPDFEDWRAQATSFAGMAIVHGVPRTLSVEDDLPENTDATEVSAGTFSLVGVKPMLGRDFTRSDEAPGAPPVAILRYGLWERRFGRDAGVIGRTVRLGGVPTTIVGVMPRGFSFPQNQDLWVPLVPTREVRQRENVNNWFVFGRLVEGIPAESARAELETIGRRLEASYPATNTGVVPIVYTFTEFFIGSNATRIYQAMWGAVGFVLLIACANLANLLLARAAGRSREISVRVALGAGRWPVMRQLLIESMVLSVLGGFCGWVMATWGVRIYALAATGAAISDATPGGWFDQVLDYSMDYRVFAYLVAISVGGGLLFGLAPALRCSRLDVNATLKDSGRGAAGGRRRTYVSSLLVVAEMALAVVLLAGTGVMIRSFLNVYTADVGVRTDNLLATLVSLPKVRYANADSQASFYDSLETRLEGIAGVESVAISNQIPGWRVRPIPYELDGAPPSDEAQRRPTVPKLVIGSGYFRTLALTLRAGREFTAADRASGVPVAVVNERFAEQHWPGEGPLGKRFRLFDVQTPSDWLTVVGLAPNIVQNDPTRQETDPLVYVPYQQQPGEDMWLVARTSVSPNGLVAAVRREVRAIDAELPIAVGPVSVADRSVPASHYRGFTAVLFLIFAAIALLLASVGLYAVIAHSVSQRTQEIGTRMAIGATASDIRALVLRLGMLPLGMGLVVGLAASVAVNRILRAQLVHVSPADPVTYAVVAVVLVVFAMLGCWIPARRAMRLDPVVALAHE